jgi:hypothetical protein
MRRAILIVAALLAASPAARAESALFECFAGPSNFCHLMTRNLTAETCEQMRGDLAHRTAGENPNLAFVCLRRTPEWQR